MSHSGHHAQPQYCVFCNDLFMLGRVGGISTDVASPSRAHFCLVCSLGHCPFFNNSWCFWMSVCFQTRGWACLQRDFSQEGLLNNAHGPSLYLAVCLCQRDRVGGVELYFLVFQVLNAGSVCFCTPYLSPLELSVVSGQMGGAETCI